MSDILNQYLDALAFGVTELHAKATWDAYLEGYKDGHTDGYKDAEYEYGLDTDQGDEEPFLSEEYYDPFTRDVDYDGFLKDLPKAEGPKGFKVGDRVRVTEAYSESELTGAEATVIDIGDTYIHLDKVGEIMSFLVRPEEIELATRQQEQISPGTKVRVLTGVNIIDSQLVEGREGFVIEVAGEEHTHHRASGQTVLVGFPGNPIERPDKSYTQTWWLSPEALEVVA